MAAEMIVVFIVVSMWLWMRLQGKEAFGGDGPGGDGPGGKEEKGAKGGLKPKGALTQKGGLPKGAESHNPRAAAKALDYLERFEAARAMFFDTRSTRVRRRAYDAMLSLSAKTMKHLGVLASWFPNDLDLDSRFRAFSEETELRMHRTLELCARLAYEDRKEVYLLDKVKLDSEMPVGYNYVDYIQ